MKCAKIYNARAQLLFCSLNLLFSDVLVAVVVLVCSSLFIRRISALSNAVETIDKEMICFIIYCFELHSTRGRNVTYERE